MNAVMRAGRDLAAQGGVLWLKRSHEGKRPRVIAALDHDKPGCKQVLLARCNELCPNPFRVVAAIFFLSGNRKAVSTQSPMLPRSGYVGVNVKKGRSQPRRGCVIGDSDPR